MIKCKFCYKEFTQLGCSTHETFCNLNPNKKFALNRGIKHNDDIKSKISASCKVKKINADHLLRLNEKDKLFKLSAFCNMIIGDKIHQNEEFAGIKLLYHMYEFNNNVRLIFNLLEEIIHDYVNFKIVKFLHCCRNHRLSMV